MSVPRPLAALPVVFALLLPTACGDGSDTPRAKPAPQRSPPATPNATATEPPAAPEDRVAWTHAQVLRRLDGRRIRVGGRRVPIDGATLTCGGIDRAAARVRGEPAWTRFRCVQPTFPAGSVAGPDAVFVVDPTGRRTFEITERRLTRY